LTTPTITINCRKIASQYGLTVNGKAKPLSSVYRRQAAYHVSTEEQGDIIIKPFHGNRTSRLTVLQQIRIMFSHIEELEAGQYPYLPRFLRTGSGKYWVLVRDRPFYIMEWIDGRELQGEEEYKWLGKALASLHTFSHPELQQSFSSTLNQLRNYRNQHMLFCRRLGRMKRQNNFRSHWIRQNGGLCLELVDEAERILAHPDIKELLAREKTSPATLIHGDITWPNVKVRDGGVLLLDWDSMGIGSSYFELAKALMNLTRYEPALVRSLLQGYEEVKPLSPAERMLIWAIFSYPREVWIAARKVDLHHDQGMLDLVRQTWEARVKMIQWLEEWATLGSA